MKPPREPYWWYFIHLTQHSTAHQIQPELQHRALFILYLGDPIVRYSSILHNLFDTLILSYLAISISTYKTIKTIKIGTRCSFPFICYFILW